MKTYLKSNPLTAGLRLRLGFVGAGLLMVAGCATHAPTAPDEHLPVPADAAERAYLGLPAETGTFQLENIRCEILVVDCFDMYCHVCQAGAPHMNELYRLTQEHGLGDRIKFIGLGVGDTPLEVATYKQKLQVPFPVFPDRHMVVATSFGPVRLPNLLVLRNQNGHLELIQSVTGTLLDPAGLFAHLQAELAELKLHSWSNDAQLAQPTCNKNAATGRGRCPYPGALTDGATLPLF